MRRRRRISGYVGVLFGLGACSAPEAAIESVTDSTVLLEADRAFSRSVSEGGSEAWAEWFTADGAIVRESVGEIRGRAAVREAVAFLDAPGVSLSWEPTRADIARSGDLGWTTGRFVSVSPGPDGAELRATGVYVSIWRLQRDGSWKVVMDLGNPAPE